MDDAVHIRLASSADGDSLAPLFAAYRFHFNNRADHELGRQFLKERLARSDSVIYLAEIGNTVDGFVQLYPLFSSWHARRLWFLSDLFVAPEARGRRIATRLVARVRDHMLETQAKGVMVEIPFSEPHLVKFYERAGYCADRTFQLYRLGETPGPNEQH